MTIRHMVSVLVFAACTATQANDPCHDGSWWAISSNDQRLGYLAGYLDCGFYDRRVELLGRISWYELAPRVTRYYLADSARGPMPVSAVALKLAAPDLAQKPRKGAEAHIGMHGVFDGEYWRQIGPEGRAAFVAGYLDCRFEDGLQREAFPNPAHWYATRISAWYGISNVDPSEINEARASAKIAHVLAGLQKR